MIEINFKDWKLLVDKEKTLKEYSQIEISGAESCRCSECQNYIAFRNQVFPKIIKQLFDEIGIDYSKEVEITYWEKLENGLYYIGGWFHFIGKFLEGKRCNEPLPHGNGNILSLEKIEDDFSIGFDERKSLTFFKNYDDLVQLEFSTYIPWVIDNEKE